ncbi:hypothetical protein HHK36_009500 [Tetracentron sinense]|uniref:Uncharacterized protein n=1 Tax=Tetracentron sinense TaxID=13715 RepID=A0A835DHJ0_TETSI|nr:hypothetical protein HHK36_009500 [Tetracentron sinense]
MSKFSCFSLLVGRKNKYKVEAESSDLDPHNKRFGTLLMKLEHPKKSSNTNELNSTSFSVPVPLDIQENSTCNVELVRDVSPVGVEADEVDYEGEDEHDENYSIRRDFSDLDLQAQVANGGEEVNQSMTKNMNSSNKFYTEINAQSETKLERDAEMGVDLIRSGHVSDPGIGKAEFWASPKLKRSCSNFETRDVLKKVADQLPPSKSHSFEDLQYLTERVREEVFIGAQGSPMSVMTACSADRVMLKKHSSSQVLPSRSKSLWWKLFLWSHRNLHKSYVVKPRPLAISLNLNQQGGYSSDTLEPNRATGLGKLELPGSYTGESSNQCCINNNSNQNWDNFQGGGSGLWLQNQWVAFSPEASSLTRVDEWVNSLNIQHPLLINDEDTDEEGIFFPPPDTCGSPERSAIHMTRIPNLNTSQEVLHANNVIQSLNSSSTVAHITGMGLKVIPTISHFSSLRSINLSGNFIVRLVLLLPQPAVHITPGLLPKCLHALSLSRNKIAAIEGLKELTRLRVLDLSYNRISRIGHGLSNCTHIKELYLAGNKISDVEGLHRLLKLTILDLSFNKISTVKALGQLVAHYNSLLALNLVGNPIQSNSSDDHLRKAVSGLLPQLAYLNKQSIKPQRGREMATDSVAKAALRDNGWTSQRKTQKRVSQVGSLSSSGHRSSISGEQKIRHMRKSHSHHHSSMKRRSSTLASSSH